MEFEDRIRRCLILLREQQATKKECQDYYEGEHDITRTYDYNESRSNMVVVVNFFKKFIHDEVAYALGNSPTYTTSDDDHSALNKIEDNFSKWHRIHNQKLALEGIKFGESYEIKYTTKDNEFKCAVLTPLNTFVLESGDVEKKVTMGLHVYKEDLFSTREKLDVYFENKIYTYNLSAADDLMDVSKRTINFSTPPIKVFSANLDRKSLLYDIKELNDSYNVTLSNLVNEVSDFRQALLKTVGAKLEEEDIPNMKKRGVIDVPIGGNVEYLIKELNDTFVQNLLNTLEDKMYKAASHVDTNQKLQSNLSGSALRSRLIALENKCVLLQSMLEDVDKERLKDFFAFIKKKEKVAYDSKKIKLKLSMNIPSDITILADSFSKLKDFVSHETLLSQIPFVENPTIEMEKWFAEQKRKKELDISDTETDNT